MKNLKFPTAQTILILIAVFVTLLTWIVPAGKYDSLAYNATTSTFTKTSVEVRVELPATQETLENLNIKIPIVVRIIASIRCKFLMFFSFQPETCSTVVTEK